MHYMPDDLGPNFRSIEYFLMKISQYFAGDLKIVLAKFHLNRLRICRAKWILMLNNDCFIIAIAKFHE